VIRVVVAGAAGRMGSLVVPALSQAEGIELAGTLVRGSDAVAIFELCRPDVLVDFTIAESSRELGLVAAERGICPIIGTSGLTPADISALREACRHGGVGGLVVPNFSIGAVLQMRFAEQAAARLPCAGLRETHHPGKKDSPSGTALATARRIEGASGVLPPIESQRREGLVALQEVSFAQPGERLELVHEVTDRRAYLPGVLLAVRAVRGLRELAVGLDALLG
jgi:4-hydroxy-tetrahydrodipicolinate reductase